MYLFVSAAQVKTALPSPFDAFAQLLFVGLFVYVAIMLGIFFLKRGLAWLDDRFWITYSGDAPEYGTLANAFLELQSMAQPEKQCVIEMKEEEKQKKEQDDIGGSDDPNAVDPDITPGSPKLFRSSGPSS